MKLTRKELLVGGAAGAALGAAGIYELVDKLADSSPSEAAAAHARNQASIAVSERIQDEDAAICASVQRGLRSRSRPPRASLGSR